MSDLSEFLLARIAEDEEVARAATPGPWRVESRDDDPAGSDPYLTVVGLGGESVIDAGGEYCGDLWVAADQVDLAHVVRHHPARVLAECEAKRRIVEEHPIYRGPRTLAVDSSGTDYGCELCHCIDPIRADGIIEANGYCETLRLLALPYASHPDYREEWRP